MFLLFQIIKLSHPIFHRSADTCDVILNTKENVPIYAHSAILRQANTFFRKTLSFGFIAANFIKQKIIRVYNYAIFNDIIMVVFDS